MSSVIVLVQPLATRCNGRGWLSRSWLGGGIGADAARGASVERRCAGREECDPAVRYEPLTTMTEFKDNNIIKKPQSNNTHY